VFNLHSKFKGKTYTDGCVTLKSQWLHRRLVLEDRIRQALTITLVVSFTSLFLGLSMGPIIAPVALAQDEAQDGEIIVFDDDLAEVDFFTESPTEVTSDATAGMAGPENEPDTFAYSENLFPNVAGLESALQGPNQLYLPTLETQLVQGQEVVVNSAAGRTYYIDCAGGNDNNSGLGKSAAWKSLTPTRDATLGPGDSLLLKRGCSWTGPLDAKWSGTSNNRIIIGAYGSGYLPKIQNAYSANVRISGKYQIIQDIHTTLSTPPDPDANCNNQPRGWKSGFSFENGSSYNTVRAAKATRLTIGVFFHVQSHHNRLLNSTITDNNVLEKLTSAGAHGASGVSLHGNHHEIARNYFANNRSICTYNGVVESISIELYTASNSKIHHNVAYNDRVFVELGSTSQWRSENNMFAYNLFVSDYAHSSMGARFIVTRGYNHEFGPVLGTQLYNNVVYLTGSGSKGISCQQCDNGILTVRNNILWANDEPFSTDNGFIESHNIFWSNDGQPGLRWRGFTKAPSSVVTNPNFTNPGNRNFTLQSGSPAIDEGTMNFVDVGYGWDLSGKRVPISGILDIGAYEAP
jgi:hypothetical protein